MAAESRRRSSTPVETALNNTTFSMDSLQIGDSTRSLLSPLYDKADEYDSERSSGSKSRSSKKYITDVNKSDKGDKNDSTYSSDYEESGNIKDSVSRSSSSFSSATSSGSPTPDSRIRADVNAEMPESSKICYSGKAPSLSPWESWLLAKVVEDEKRAKANKKNKLIKKENRQKETQEMTEKERRAKEDRKEWLRVKRKEEKTKKELTIRKEQENARKREEEQARIQAKAEESFEKWLEAKKNEHKEQTKNKRMNEQVKKENELQRKQKSDEAYKQWLENAKHYQKSKNNHFGYLGGKVTGYYDWTCYPMPSYSNPKPWVPPKIKARYQSKVKLQNPSPPLLFKEIEQRELNRKQNDMKTKQCRNSVG